MLAGTTVSEPATVVGVRPVSVAGVAVRFHASAWLMPPLSLTTFLSSVSDAVWLTNVQATR